MVHFILHVMTQFFFSFPLTKSIYTISYFLDNIYIRIGTKLYKKIVGISMSTNCAPLIADLYFTATNKANTTDNEAPNLDRQ